MSSCKADVVRVWDKGEGTRGGGGELPRKRPEYSSSRFYIHLNSYEADDDRVWDEGEGTRGGGMGELPKKKIGILFVSLL